VESNCGSERSPGSLDHAALRFEVAKWIEYRNKHLMSLVQSSDARSLVLRVLANGQVLYGAVEAWVSSTSSMAADSFGVVIAVGGAPYSGAAAWSSQPNITVDVQLSVDGGVSYSSLIYGTVDSVVIEPFLGIIRLDGRDLTSLLVASNVQDSYINQTSSEIVSSVALRHGLFPNLTVTSEIVGNFDTNSRDILTLNQFSRALTDWDLLVALANHEQFELYVSGTQLCFLSQDQVARDSYIVTPGDLTDLRMEWALPLAGNISVTVKSWNHWLQQAVITTTSNSSSPSASPSDTELASSGSQYQLTRPNLTSSDADSLAQRQLDQISSHERVIECELPGELLMTPRDQIILSGTGTAFDQIYSIETIDRRISSAGGFTERIRAKNGSIVATADA
jgi:phage protein D